MRYFFREVFQNMRRSPEMSWATICITLILGTILGAFLLTVQNIRALSSGLTASLEIRAYLEDGLPKDRVEAVRRRIAALPAVGAVTFVTKDEAFVRLQKMLNNSVSLKDVGHNPLPDSFDILPASPAQVFAIQQALQDRAKYPELAKVRSPGEAGRRLLKLNETVQWAGGVVIAVLLLATLVIIHATVYLTVVARRKEIKVMQLVGAAHWFITWPFLIEGMIQGMAGCGAAVLVLCVGYQYALKAIAVQIAFLPPLLAAGHILPGMAAVVIGTGIGIGFLGSWLSIHRHLRL